MFFSKNKCFKGLSTDIKPIAPIALFGDKFYETDTECEYVYNKSLNWELCNSKADDLLVPCSNFKWASGQENGLSPNVFFDKESGKLYYGNRQNSNGHRGIIEVDLSNQFLPTERFCDLSEFDKNGSNPNKLVGSNTLNVRGITRYNNCLLVVVRAENPLPNPTQSDTNTYGILICIELTNFTVIWSEPFNERLSDINIVKANNTIMVAIAERRKSVKFYTITSSDISTGYSKLVQRDEWFTEAYDSTDCLAGMSENQKGEFCIVPTDVISTIDQLLTPHEKIVGKIIKWLGGAIETSKVDGGVLTADENYQCQEVSTNTYKWVALNNTSKILNQVLYVSAGYNSGLNVFDVTHINSDAYIDDKGHRTRAYIWDSTLHNDIWKILSIPNDDEHYGFFCFDVKVVYPYVFATLSPSPEVGSYDKNNGTTYRRMGVITFDITSLKNISGYLGSLDNMKGFMPINYMGGEGGTDHPPISMKLIGNYLYLNNSDKGAAVFDISNVNLLDSNNVVLPKFVGNIKHPMLANVNGLCLMGDNQSVIINYNGELLYDKINDGVEFMVMGENLPSQTLNKTNRNKAKNLIIYTFNTSLISPDFYLPMLNKLYEDTDTQP